MPEDRGSPSARRVRDLLNEADLTVGVAESLTGGLLVQELAKVKGSGAWLRGGVVAYDRSVKHDLLGVTAEKVVSEQAASEMASTVRDVLAADVGVAVTGVAGPERQDGEPPGTVWMAVDHGAGPRAVLLHLEGDPEEICRATTDAALELLARTLKGRS